MDRDRLDALWSRLTDGDTLDPVEQGELLEGLRGDGRLRQALLGDVRLHGLLEALAASEDDGPAFLREVQGRLAAEKDKERFAAVVGRSVRREAEARRRPRWWRRRVPALVVPPFVLAAAALALVLRPAPRPAEAPEGDATAARARPPGGAAAARLPALAPAAAEGDAHLAAVDGTVYVVRRGHRAPAETGTPLGPHDSVLTVGRASAARVRYADGTDLQLGGDGVVIGVGGGAAGASGLVMGAGTLRAIVAPRPPGRPFVIETLHATATVLGTRLTLSVSPEAMQLWVAEGRVRFRGHREDTDVDVGAGRYAVAAERAALVADAGGRPAGGLVVLLVGTATLLPDDQRLLQRIEGLGFEVRPRAGGELGEGDLVHAALVVVSPTIVSRALSISLRDAPVPILVSDAALFDDLGMTEPLERNDAGGGTHVVERGELVVRHPSHPLAAGLSGTVRVLSEPATAWWGAPSPFAAWVATPRRISQAAIFGYERGAIMMGATAPARRVGFFLYNNTAALLTETGWALFDAAVRWCAEGAR
jgi:hypothetical protein